MLVPLLAAAGAAAQQAPAPAAAASAPQHATEGAIGLVVGHGPEYLGGGEYKSSVVPGYFIRWGRYTLTNTGGFVTRRADDVHPGAAADLVQSDRLRVNLSLRFDGGRSESRSAALRDVGDVKRTVRARLSSTWRTEDGWRLGLHVGTDLLGRGGGTLAELNFGREWRLTPRIVWSLSTNLSAGTERYMKSYFGITAAQSAATGYPVHEPAASLRDIGIGTGWRVDISQRWVGFANVGASHLLGSAAGSPLTQRRSGWAASGGLAWRF